MSINVLHIDSSLFGQNGNSASLSSYLVEGLTSKYGSDVVIQHRNVATDEIPHFSAQTISAIGKGEAGLSDELIAQVQWADVVVVGVPMYNFGIPSQLKAWFDHIARAGVTFKYGENGPVGLLTGKRAYVLHARGGLHAGSPRDTILSYIDTMFGFVGITDVKHIAAEGFSMPEHKDTAGVDAHKAIDNAVAAYSQPAEDVA